MKVSIRYDKAVVRFKSDKERIEFIKLIAGSDAKITDRVGDVDMWLEVFRNAKEGDKRSEA